MFLKYSFSLVVILASHVPVRGLAIAEDMLVHPVMLQVQATSTKFYKQHRTGNADAFVDGFLAAISADPKFMSLLNPLILPNAEFKVGNVQNITVLGPIKIWRTGPSEVTFRGDQLQTVLNVGIKNLKAQAEYAFKGVRIAGRVGVLLKKINVGLRMTVAGSKVKLEKFKIHDFMAEMTEFTGTGSKLNRVSRWLINRFVRSFSRFLRGQIEKVVSYNVRTVLADFDLIEALTISISAWTSTRTKLYPCRRTPTANETKIVDTNALRFIGDSGAPRQPQLAPRVSG